MYRCEICDALSRPGQPRQVHTVMRTVPRLLSTYGGGTRQEGTRQEIEREYAVCLSCKEDLTTYSKFQIQKDVLFRKDGRVVEVVPPPPKPVPPGQFVQEIRDRKFTMEAADKVVIGTAYADNPDPFANSGEELQIEDSNRTAQVRMDCFRRHGMMGFWRKQYGRIPLRGLLDKLGDRKFTKLRNTLTKMEMATA